MSSRQLVNKGASGGVAQCRMHARYQEVAVLTDLLLTLGAKRSRYQTPYLEGVENRAHLVARDLYSLLQEPLIDYGAVKRAPAPCHSSQITSRTFSASSRALFWVA